MQAHTARGAPSGWNQLVPHDLAERRVRVRWRKAPMVVKTTWSGPFSPEFRTPGCKRAVRVPV